MTTSRQSRGSRLDERLRLMPTGTNARFALVVVLALVTSAKMVLEFAFSYWARSSMVWSSPPALIYTTPIPT